MALLRIPDPNQPPYPTNLHFSEDEDIKMLVLLVQELQHRVAVLEQKVRYLESEKNHQEFSKMLNPNKFKRR